MRFFVSHIGFVKGRPPRYRHVGEMQVLMETPVEVRKVRQADAPVVYKLESLASGTEEYRWIDGNFYRLAAHRKLKDARHGTISVEHLERDLSVRKYRERCDWRSFSSNGIGPRGTLAPARHLHDWKAAEIDDSAAHVFSDAVKELAESFVVIGTALWERCFEPCLVVQWKPSLGGKHVHVTLDVGDAGGPDAFLDPSSRDRWPGMHSGPYEGVGGTHAREHLRCFSALEWDRANAFIDGLKAKATDFRISRNDGRKLVIVEPQLASQEFDVLELRRSARIHVSALAAMTREIRMFMETKQWKAIFAQDEFETRAAQLEFVLADFEAGKAPPEDVLDAMAELRRGLAYASKAFDAKAKIDLAAFVPPEYFGDVDSFSIDIDLASSPSGLRAGP
ncbi:hypothetical protein OIU34_19950 [Pararhizobium sp. BT-229]|uniref:hypothetical protein n=1 Tax=Pararhizobium sp. BT-229 TaxID=2986923 RepID=UPI0021F7FFB6|nr:hypothetical protein [Pararhizobium sp. BT-229]MCV9964160.1 hypothetical protein [Pararhizobium sp. BT-229]